MFTKNFNTVITITLFILQKFQIKKPAMRASWRPRKKKIE